MRTLFFVALLMTSGPAQAQSSLGITGAVFSLGLVEDEGGDYRGDVSATIDVAITDVHGFQGDLSFKDAASGTVGTAESHLYMSPKEGQKYGLFAALSDVDGRSMLYGSVGAEGMFSRGDQTTIEARGGIGWADVDGLDYVFGGISVAQAISPELDIEVSLDLADFDEAGFSATAYDIGLKTNYSPEGSPWGAYASVTYSDLAGMDGASGATRIGVGLRISLGTAGGTDPRTRPFRSVDPVAPLIRRGLW